MPSRAFERRRESSGSPIWSDGKLLIDAILSADFQKARGLVMGGIDVNSARDTRGLTALHLVCMQGVVGLAHVLIRNRADVNVAAGARGFTALHLAALCEQSTTTLRLLLESKAEPNALSLEGESSLSLCAASGNVEAVRHLLKARAQADVNQPLEEEDEVEMSTGQAFGQCSADYPSAAPSRCGSPGHMAVAAGVAGEEAHLGAKWSAPVSALLRACQRNAQVELIAELVNARADLYVRDMAMNQPLHIASINNSVSVVRLLLDNRADPDSCNQDLRTPMHCAAGHGANRIIKLLVASRAQVDPRDSHGRMPLEVAADPTTEAQLRQLLARSEVRPMPAQKKTLAVGDSSSPPPLLMVCASSCGSQQASTASTRASRTSKVPSAIRPPGSPLSRSSCTTDTSLLDLDRSWPKSRGKTGDTLP